jgi:hypothetical protein
MEENGRAKAYFLGGTSYFFIIQAAFSLDEINKAKGLAKSIY